MHAKYPIGKKILEILKREQISQTELVVMLGYKNLNKGRRRLDSLCNGEGAPEFFKKLSRLYLNDKTPLIEALGETKAIKEQELIYEQRRAFEPFIWAETEKEPYNFFSGMLATALKKIRVPKRRLTNEELSKLVREHFLSNEGFVDKFGEILRYRYEPEFRKREFYDCSGNRILEV